MKPIAQEAGDQALHVLAAVVVATLARTDWLGGAFVGLGLGLVREVTEGGNVVSKGSIRDIVFWTLGGALGGWLF